MEMENSGFIALIEGGKYEDLARMYVLFKRVPGSADEREPGGLDLLRSTMGDYIRSTGRALVQVMHLTLHSGQVCESGGMWLCRMPVVSQVHAQGYQRSYQVVLQLTLQ